MATQAGNRLTTPISGFQFQVWTLPAADGGIIYIPEGEVGFKEVTGLTAETEAVEYGEGNDLYVDMLPGRTTPQELVLARGVDRNGKLIAWHKTVQERTALPLDEVRADLIIGLYNRQGVPGAGGEADPELIRMWKFFRAWPKGYAADDLTTSSGEIILERLTLCYYGPPQLVFPTV